MLKKLSLLALALGALVALAIPAAASADEWYLDEETVGIGTEEGVTFDGTGELAVVAATPLGTLELGPCIVHVEGTVWNEEEEGEVTGHGEVDELEITPVNKVGETDLCQVWALFEGATVGTVCDIVTASTDTTPPWTLAVTPGTGITISGANFDNGLSEGCPLGASTGAVGDVTGVFSNGTSSISFTNAGHMISTTTNQPVSLNGSVEITPVGEGTLTLGE